MKIYIMILGLVHGCLHMGHAKQHLGARLTAIGQNGSAVIDYWNISGNPAGIVFAPSPAIGVNYVKYISGIDLSNQSAIVSFPLKQSTISAVINRYGVGPYHEIEVGTAIGKKFGNHLSFATKLNFHQLKITGYGSTSAFSINVGAMYLLDDHFTVGIYINNPTFQRYHSDVISSRISSALYAGISYTISDKILMACTIQKDFAYETNIAVGLEYSFIEILELRGGLSFNPFKQYCGFGLAVNKLSIDLAIESDPFIPYKPQIGLTYAF